MLKTALSIFLTLNLLLITSPVYADVTPGSYSNPSVPPNSSITPQPILTFTPHEQALQHLNKGLLPDIVAETAPSKSEEALFDIKKITENILSLFKKIFGFTPADQPEFAQRSQNQFQASVPAELIITPTIFTAQDSIEKTSENLGDEVGIYVNKIPDELFPTTTPGVPKILKTCQYEQTYEQANFPEGIMPVTQKRSDCN